MIVVPGNHDHHLIEPWLERRRLEGGAPLELEQVGEPEGRAFEALCSHAAPATVRFAYPGLWVRDDVYATHGHYLDRHLTVPTVERLGVAAVERVLGMAPSTGPDPLVPRRTGSRPRSTSTSACRRPSTRSSSPSRRRPGEGRSAAVAVDPDLADAGRRRHARRRGCAAGSSAPSRSRARSGSPTGSGSGPCAPTCPPGRSAGPGSTRWPTPSTTCGSTPTTSSSATPTAAAGLSAAAGAKLWNTGSWVHAPALLGDSAAVSPYWPGTICVVGDEGEPELRHLLDDSREQLARSSPARRALAWLHDLAGEGQPDPVRPACGHTIDHASAEQDLPCRARRDRGLRIVAASAIWPPAQPAARAPVRRGRDHDRLPRRRLRLERADFRPTGLRPNAASWALLIAPLPPQSRWRRRNARARPARGVP